MLSLQTTRHLSPAEAPPGKNRGVSSLPDELLSEIFSLVQNDPFARSWCRVLWVCRRWSVLGRSVAILWSKIVIEPRSRYSLIVASLEYSKNAYLTIELNGTANYSQILSLLSPHIHRIRILKIYDVFGTRTYGRRLAAFLNHSFSSLEIFEETVMPPARGYMTWRPDASRYPRLRHIRLEGSLSIDVASSAVLSALRTLELGYQDEPSFTLPSFVQFLSHHPHLEDVRLHQCNFALGGAISALTFPPTIQHFTLEDYTGFIKDYLSAFTHIPAYVHLCITREYDETEFWTDFAANHSLFVANMLPESPQQHLSVLLRVSSLKIECRPDYYYNLAGRVHPSDTSPLIQLNNQFPNEFSWEPPFQRLANATQIFAGAPITEVRLVGDRDFYPPSPAAEWMALDVFPLLEHIAIEDITPLEYVPIEDIMFYQTLDIRTGLLEALRAPSPGGGTRWPRLRRLTLACGDWENRDETSLVDLLPRVLRHRAERGAKVAKLCLIFNNKAWEAGIEEKDRLASEVVERVAWKDIVDDVRVKFVQPWITEYDTVL